MARLPWQLWFDACTSRDGPNQTALAEQLRSIAKSGGKCPPELLLALAELLDPPADYSGTTMRMVRPKGGKTIDWRQQYAMASDLRDSIVKRVKPLAAVYEVSKRYGVSERTVWRTYETVKASTEEGHSTADIENAD